MRKKLFLGLLLASLVSTDAQAADDIVVGALLPLTGAATDLGTGNELGMKVALKEINDAGGINGRRIKVVVEDTRSDAATAVNAFRKLVDTDHVSFVLTTLTNVTMAIRPIAEQRKVLLLAESAHPDLTKGSTFVLRNFITVDFVNEKLVTFIAEKKLSRVAVLHAEEDWGQAAVDDLSRRQASAHFEILEKQSFSKNATDARAQIARIAAKKPELIYVVGFGPAAAMVYRQLAEAKTSAEIVGYLACGRPDILKVITDAQLSMKSIDMSLDPRNPRFENLLRLVKSTDPSRQVDQEVVTGYDGLSLLAEAFRRGHLEPTAAQRFMVEHGAFHGASGDIVFGENGDSRRPLAMSRISEKGCQVLEDGEASPRL